MLSTSENALNFLSASSETHLFRSHAKCVAVEAEPPLPSVNTWLSVFQASCRIPIDFSIEALSIFEAIAETCCRYSSERDKLMGDTPGRYLYNRLAQPAPFGY